jgi:hypothetical protein
MNLRGDDDTNSQDVLFEHARGTSTSAEDHERKEQQGDDEHTGEYYYEDHPPFATVS